VLTPVADAVSKDASPPNDLRLRGHLLVLLVFGGLVSLYTWPLVTDPGHLLPDNHDPRLYGWVMPTMFRNLVSHPSLLYHGTAFYPFGNTLTFAESLLTPALLGGPLFLLTRNPVLAYNLTLLLLWTLSGWAMFAVVYWVTRHRAAAFVAALAFTLCPMRIEYYVELQIQTLFGIPLVVFAVIRFFEDQRPRHLAAALAIFWAQAVAVQYYTVILGLGLVMVVLQCLALRGPLWRVWTFVMAAVGLVALALGLAPTLRAYALTRRELGFERSIEDAALRSADVLTYLEPRSNRLYHAARASVSTETTLLLGFGALALALLGLLWLRRPPRPRGRLERALGAAVWACVGLGLLMCVMRRPVGRDAWSAVGAAVLVLILARHAAEGWRRRGAAWSLTEREWVGILLGLAAWAFLLSLGPVARVAGEPIGSGLHRWLYPLLLPLHAVRFVTRFGILVVFVGACLAGLGVKWLDQRLPAGTRRPVLAGLTLLLLLEYASFPLVYHAVAAPARPVDLAIRADPGEAAVLELPTNVPAIDADAMLWSLAHGKYVVNGYAGFPDPWLVGLSGLLVPSGPSFPAPAALAAMRRLYPLRYLVVRLADRALPPELRDAWLRVREAPPPGLRFRGTFEDTDLYELVPAPERGARIERLVSYAFLLSHPRLRIMTRPLVASPALDQWVEVSLNGRSRARVPLAEVTTVTVRLGRRLSRVAPNVITVQHGYRRPPAALDARYRIGATGARAAGDLAARSSGDGPSPTGSVRFNGVELAANHPGYNLAALDSGGRLVGSAVFDTAARETASDELAAWIDALAPGTIVAGAVREDGSRHLTEKAVQALRALGVAGDLRGHVGAAHAFVGVKGARPGTALEALGPRPVEVRVGEADGGLGLELMEFELEGAAPLAVTGPAGAG
jgi:hypothetical protein